MKKIFAFIWLMVLSLVIGAIFWYSDFMYSLPTPVPINYKPVATGTLIKLPAEMEKYNNKPLFIHFYNPACPCSRFNKIAFKQLATQYSKQLNFVIVVLSKNTYSENR